MDAVRPWAWLIMNPAAAEAVERSRGGAESSGNTLGAARILGDVRDRFLAVEVESGKGIPYGFGPLARVLTRANLSWFTQSK